MRYLRSLTVRMVLSHMLIATLTCIITMAILVLVLIKLTQVASIEHYRALARETVAAWQFSDPQGLPNALGLPPGLGLVVAPDDTILFSRGDTPCRVGMRLRDCAAELIARPEGAQFFTRNGQRWGEVVQPTATGQRVMVQYGPLSGEPSLMLADVVITGTIPFLLVITGAMLVISVPLSLILAWLWARPLIRRVSLLAQVSQRFAGGDFAVRVNEHRQDEIGALAQQFDAMADTLALNVSVLRDLAERNAQLAQQAEQSAILAERARLSRDLHDEIAQQLFSLSVSAATLPSMIEQDTSRGVVQAQSIAERAEQTLLSLRTLLIELRPADLVERGLAAALQELCAAWQAAHPVALECSVVVTGKRIAAGIEDALYRIAQEALNNVAKHAQASSVVLALVEGQRQITLSISDDGVGFDPTYGATSGHFGLISMRERAAAVGGCLEIESDTARGTTLRVTLPLDRAVADITL
jgi:signal transduction histidine kinase